MSYMPEVEETKRCFVDTNIWLYAFIESGDAAQRQIAKAVAGRSEIVVSVQVINETCVNLLKKAATSETIIRQLVTSFYDKYTVIDFDAGILLTASELREKYSFSFWDSIIIASALRAGCEALYTEDMQHGLKVDDQLTIVNPFYHD
jgi:predicted nucleic acid-binding protein